MTDPLERWIRWTLKYGYIITYVSAALIALVTAFLIYYYVHPHH
jgi:hypothetical protein